MQPRDTLYRIASAGADYRACHQLNRRLGKDWGQLHFPTVVAERDGEIIGYLSTRPITWCLMAGPLETLRPNPIMSMRLIEAYEAVCKAAGITRYCFAIDKHHQEWAEQVKTSGVLCIAEDDNDWIFERILPGDPFYAEPT